jgi:ABC-2 type transport system ATP-binding protein
MTAHISVKNLTKTFKIEQKQTGFWRRLVSIFRPMYTEKLAVDAISFQIQSGERVAFIGPNGAGKSTTIKMLVGILSATSGEARVLGYDPLPDRSKLIREIGVLFGQVSKLWYHLTPQDTFDLFRRLYHIPKEVYQVRLEKFVEVLEIASFVNQPVRKLSLGQRMRAEIVASLLHSPKILFLDEPTIGLDLIAKRKLRESLRKLNEEEGTTIFLTSHDIADVEEVCDRAIIVANGKIAFDGTLDELRRNHIPVRRVELRFARMVNFVLPKDATLISQEGLMVAFEVPNNPAQLQLLFAQFSENPDLEDISITTPPLEEIIAGFY